MKKLFMIAAVFLLLVPLKMNAQEKVSEELSKDTTPPTITLNNPVVTLGLIDDRPIQNYYVPENIGVYWGGSSPLNDYLYSFSSKSDLNERIKNLEELALHQEGAIIVLYKYIELLEKQVEKNSKALKIQRF